MRQIEENMLNAVRARRNWSEGNTQVATFPANITRVFLHGNHIATIRNQGKRVEVNANTLRQWPTATTLSRLRALGVAVRKHKGEILIDGQPI